jgi:hypothetical protein
MSGQHFDYANHIEELAEEIPEVSESIGAGRAFLKVLTYPWGVELDVCYLEGGSP